MVQVAIAFRTFNSKNLKTLLGYIMLYSQQNLRKKWYAFSSQFEWSYSSLFV